MISRNTKQKNTLNELIQKCPAFFSAEDLLEKAKKTEKTTEKKISIATVYRFLKEKVKAQELSTYQCERRTIYSTKKKQPLPLYLRKNWKNHPLRHRQYRLPQEKNTWRNYFISN